MNYLFPIFVFNAFNRNKRLSLPWKLNFLFFSRDQSLWTYSKVNKFKYLFPLYTVLFSLDLFDTSDNIYPDSLFIFFFSLISNFLFNSTNTIIHFIHIFFLLLIFLLLIIFLWQKFYSFFFTFFVEVNLITQGILFNGLLMYVLLRDQNFFYIFLLLKFL